MSITVVNLHDNRAVFRIFIALLRFSFDSPSYLHDERKYTTYLYYWLQKLNSPDN